MIAATIDPLFAQIPSVLQVASVMWAPLTGEFFVAGAPRRTVSSLLQGKKDKANLEDS